MSAKDFLEKCGNCMDGALVMAGETCGVCGFSVPAKRLSKAGPEVFETQQRERTQVLVLDQTISIQRLENGQVWINHKRGEGMVANEALLAKVIEKFFWKEF